MFRGLSSSRSGRFVAMAIAALLAVVAWSPSKAAHAVPSYPLALRGYEIVSAITEMNAFSVKSASARCSSGKKVLGGGAAILGSTEAALFWNGPARSPGGGSWTAAAQSGHTNGTWSLEVYAICAKVTGFQWVDR